MSRVTFGIYLDEDCTEAVGDLITIEDEAVVVKLEVGTYYVKVVGVPEKYRLDSTVYTVEVSENETYELSVCIELSTGYLLLKSVDDDGANLSGVTFGIYLDEDCTEPACDSVIIENEPITIELLVGTYYVKMTEVPDKYVLSDTIYSVDVVSGDITELVVEIKAIYEVHFKYSTGNTKPSFIISTLDGEILLEGVNSEGADYILNLQEGIYCFYTDDSIIVIDKDENFLFKASYGNAAEFNVTSDIIFYMQSRVYVPIANY